MAEPGKWGDLSVRVASGVAMAILGLVNIVLGGVWFEVLVVCVTAIIVWELAMMIAPEKPTPAMLLAVMAGAVFSGDLRGWTLSLFLLAPILGALALPRKKLLFFGFSLYVVLGGWGLVYFRAELGMGWLLWLLAVVIVTDIAGYFAGRTFGGPKFWPAVSPKKTWAGTAAGWAGAAVVGLLFAMFTKDRKSVV